MEINLKGYRTKIAGWVTALAGVAAMVGYEYDPVMINEFLDGFAAQIAVLFGMGGAAIHWFRNQANKR
jgi:hypothetical protein